tara:strand:+ start:63 stop:263 length:201 start_codon:yes stop_codon:yes gene_type:complete
MILQLLFEHALPLPEIGMVGDQMLLLGHREEEHSQNGQSMGEASFHRLVALEVVAWYCWSLACHRE